MRIFFVMVGLMLLTNTQRGRTPIFGLPYEIPEAVQAGTTHLAINVGGTLIPALLSIYLVVRTRMWGGCSSA